MAKLDIQAAFLGRFWAATESAQPAAWEVLETIKPEVFEHGASAFNFIAARFAAGEPIQRDSLVMAAAGENGDALLGVLTVDAKLDGVAGLKESAILLIESFQRRQFDELLTKTQGWLQNGKGKHGGRAAAQELAARVLMLYGDASLHGQPASFSEILDAEILLMQREEDSGIPIPYPRLESVCGPLIPGDVVGLSAFSGGGKSTFAANLALRWVKRGFPVLAFPTEMKAAWVRRILCADAGVPQRIGERSQWRRAEYEQSQNYRGSIDDARLWPLEIVNRPNISPAEIASATRILRKRWSGRPVVVIVDHMHRLDYGKDDPNEAVGPATKMIKDFCSSDHEGGLIFLLLFQPRKPMKGDTHRPIAAQEIRGNSMVWNELDVHMSPFRTWVKTSQWGMTSSNTQRTQLDPNGRPVLAKPESEGSKLCDEHVFVKVDKRRVGGEGPTLWLEFDSPSGLISEVEHAQT